MCGRSMRSSPWPIQTDPLPAHRVSSHRIFPVQRDRMRVCRTSGSNPVQSVGSEPRTRFAMRGSEARDPDASFRGTTRRRPETRSWPAVPGHSEGLLHWLGCDHLNPFLLPRRTLNPDNVQAGDELEVADVGGPDAIAELEGTDPDEQIGKRDTDPARLALSVDLAGAESDGDGHRLDGASGEQIVEETLPAVAAVGRVGAGDAVGKFEHGDHGNGDPLIAGFKGHAFEQLPGCPALAFSGNGRRRVQHQSQAGGSRGSRWAAMAEIGRASCR